ncbi:MAG: hypothetical protein Q9218_004613 [Villophora microphyllina]
MARAYRLIHHFHSSSKETIKKQNKQPQTVIGVRENEDDFNPDQDGQNYEQIARNLPVFFTPSLAYQQSQGRQQEEECSTIFIHSNVTGIPALQHHCTKLTVPAGLEGSRSCLTAFSQLVNSLRLWLADDNTGATLTGKDSVVLE